MPVRCRICAARIESNRILKNRFFREMYQDVICKWLNIKDHSRSSLCQPCTVDVMDFYKFKQLSRRNIPKANASDDDSPEALPEVLQSLLDGCKESVELPAEVLQGLDPRGPHMGPVDRNVQTKKLYRKHQRKTEEEKAMTPDEYRKHYNRKMWLRYQQVCMICGKTIIKTRMEGHMNGHMGLEPYSCPHCNMAFNCRMNLANHIKRMHTVQLPCEKCGQIINGQMQLKRHMLQVHSGQSFSCHICNSKFRQSSYLQKHMQALHSDQRDYVCTVCGKAFFRKFVLDVHLRTHTREEAYRCEICSKGFIHRRLYTLHMDKLHPGQPKSSKSDGRMQGKRTLMKKLY